MPWDRIVLTSSFESDQKDKPWEWDFSRELSLKSNSANSLVIGAFREHHTHLHPSVPARLLIFTATNCGCKAVSFQGCGRTGERKMRVGSIKMLQSVFLMRFSPFFFNKCSPYFCKPLVNFQSSEKVNFEHFFPLLLLLS